MLGDDLAGDGMQSDGAQVVSEALPGSDRIGTRGARQRVCGRKTLEPGVPPGDDAIDLGLLQHHLGDQNRVRVARTPPGQVARTGGVPVEQAPLDARHVPRLGRHRAGEDSRWFARRSIGRIFKNRMLSG